jgi:hypothetical protein
MGSWALSGFIGASFVLRVFLSLGSTIRRSARRSSADRCGKCPSSRARKKALETDKARRLCWPFVFTLPSLWCDETAPIPTEVKRNWSASNSNPAMQLIVEKTSLTQRFNAFQKAAVQLRVDSIVHYVDIGGSQCVASAGPGHRVKHSALASLRALPHGSRQVGLIWASSSSQRSATAAAELIAQRIEAGDDEADTDLAISRLVSAGLAATLSHRTAPTVSDRDSQRR